MILDFEKSETPASFSCDVAIVGAGAVGVAMAAELARQGVDVLLLEGGGAAVEPAAQALNGAHVSGRAMEGLDHARFRLLGGTTNFWGGQIVRFDASVFGPQTWQGHIPWPFSLEELDPFYAQCSRLLGAEPDDGEEDKLWLSLGAARPMLGPEIEAFLAHTLLKRNMADIFQADLNGPRLKVLLHANCVALAGDADRARVGGVKIRTFCGRKGLVHARRVVLANGTVEIARLLQSPLSDGARAPWADNPWLGRGFFDHLGACAGEARPRDLAAFHAVFDNFYHHHGKFVPRLRWSEAGARAAHAPAVSGCFLFRSRYTEQLEALKTTARTLLIGSRPKALSKAAAQLSALWPVAGALAWRHLVQKRAFNPSEAGIDFVLTAEQIPLRDSRIALASGVNALGAPNIEVDWKVDGRELAAMADFTERCQGALARAGLADLEIDPALAARDPAFLERATDTYHQMGGARIGAGAQDGVVDANLRVHGGENLYVCGAAVFPSSGFANPTFTAMALGLRLCAHLTRAVASAPAAAREPKALRTG